MSKILSIIGWLIVLSSFISIFIGSDYEIIGETPCVDGLNRVNLEGMMCEDRVETWFGYNKWFMGSTLIGALVGMFFVYLGDKFAKTRKSE